MQQKRKNIYAIALNITAILGILTFNKA